MKACRISLYYKGVCVGLVVNVALDMWHMRGDWAGGHEPLVDEFEQAAEKLEFRTVFRNYKSGIVVRCRDGSEDGFMAVVTGLNHGVLGLMRFSSGDALNWAERTYASSCVE